MDHRIFLRDVIGGETPWSDYSEMLDAFEAEATAELVRAGIHDVETWLKTLRKGFSFWSEDLQGAFFAGRVLMLVDDVRATVKAGDTEQAAVAAANLTCQIMALRLDWLQFVIDKGLKSLHSDPRKAADAKAARSRAETQVLRHGIYALIQKVGIDQASADRLERELAQYTHRKPLRVEFGVVWITGDKIKYKKDGGKARDIQGRHFDNLVSEQRKIWPARTP